MPTYELPAAGRRHRPRRRSTSSPRCCATRAWHEQRRARPRERRAAAAQPVAEPGRPAVGHGRPGARRRRPARRPAHRHHRLLRLGRRRQDDDVGGARAAGGRARPQGRGAHHRPGPAAGPVDGDRGARQHPAAGRRRRQDSDGRRQPRRDDARHEAHLRRGGREPGQPREGAADPGEPVLHRAVELVRGDAGVHGDGEARADPRRRAARRHLRPDRRRHPAVAVGAGLPRRSRAALELPRRPVHQAAAGSGARARPG